MRLVLHIGTHKTGTSALQQCLRRNERLLLQRGIYYARGAQSRNSNLLARSVAKGYLSESKAFLSRKLDKARAAGAHTMLISAESFYAMSLFFHRLNGRAQSSQEYWAYETSSVKNLRFLLPAGTHTTVIAIFRRQDRFLDSIYGQLVKSNSLAMPIEQFRSFAAEALDYWQHMQLWVSAFPDCVVYTYEQASKNISTFFLRDVLELKDTYGFEGTDLRLNNQLSRDVLEYKRMLNAGNVSSVDSRLNELACRALSRIAPSEGPHDYLAPALRASLLKEAEAGNLLLQKRFRMAPFPAFSEVEPSGWQPYPGLSSELVSQLREAHARIKLSAKYRIMHLVLTARQVIKWRVPMLPWRRAILSWCKKFSS